MSHSMADISTNTSGGIPALPNMPNLPTPEKSASTSFNTSTSTAASPVQSRQTSRTILPLSESLSKEKMASSSATSSQATAISSSTEFPSPSRRVSTRGLDDPVTPRARKVTPFASSAAVTSSSGKNVTGRKADVEDPGNDTTLDTPVKERIDPLSKKTLAHSGRLAPVKNMTLREQEKVHPSQTRSYLQY